MEILGLIFLLAIVILLTTILKNVLSPVYLSSSNICMVDIDWIYDKPDGEMNTEVIKNINEIHNDDERILILYCTKDNSYRGEVENRLKELNINYSGLILGNKKYNKYEELVLGNRLVPILYYRDLY